MRLCDKLVLRKLFTKLFQGYVLLGDRQPQKRFLPQKKPTGGYRWSEAFQSYHPILSRTGVCATTSVEVAMLEASVAMPRDCWSWYKTEGKRREGRRSKRITISCLNELRLSVGYIHILSGRHFGFSQDRPSCYANRPIKPIDIIRITPSIVRELIQRRIIHVSADSVI